MVFFAILFLLVCNFPHRDLPRSTVGAFPHLRDALPLQIARKPLCDAWQVGQSPWVVTGWVSWKFDWQAFSNILSLVRLPDNAGKCPGDTCPMTSQKIFT